MAASRSPRMFSAFTVMGWELDGRRIWWDGDDPTPWMSVPAADGGEICTRVSNPAFAVAPGPIGKRRPALRRAALAFFAPLLADD